MNPAEKYILQQREPWKDLLLQAKVFIERHVPEAEMRYKHGIPFYYLKNRPFCYLLATPKYADLGIVRGSLLTNNTDHLETGKRKTVRSLRYKKPEDMDVEVLESVLREAAGLY
ncbi:DUF1801 domain-containing protein [Robertkochia sediminum]|uniref:DUF1801 domain-containing protein n=1 Tax=Robertkochia sediminum TaxID=2785326 RepID=UPI00193282F0|nr:DUF1801 domain-containing protein [Robertkochia sediminum]MBL7472304.1 DUF1801 domain-containing protein [Robertkochia sediminum]